MLTYCISGYTLIIILLVIAVLYITRPLIPRKKSTRMWFCYRRGRTIVINKYMWVAIIVTVYLIFVAYRVFYLNGSYCII